MQHAGRSACDLTRLLAAFRRASWVRAEKLQVWSHRFSSLSVLCEQNKIEINSLFVSLSVVLAACWWFGRRCEQTHTYTSVGTLSGTDVRWHHYHQGSVCVFVCVFHSIYSNRRYFLGSGAMCVSIVFPSCALESCSAAAGGTKATAALLA